MVEILNNLGDGVDLLGDGGDPRNIAGGSSKTTVAQNGDQRLEIPKCDQPTYQPTNQLTWVGARDTCVSKNVAPWSNIKGRHLKNKCLFQDIELNCECVGVKSSKN